jgi:succinate dehydrogenase / fumarate reductase cytochrome b subunit
MALKNMSNTDADLRNFMHNFVFPLETTLVLLSRSIRYADSCSTGFPQNDIATKNIQNGHNPNDSRNEWMMKKQTVLLSSIGQKLLLATSGLVMFLLFLIPHMGGNVLFLFGPEIFNSYAMHLHELLPIVIGIEVLMLISISIHMIIAARVVKTNLRASTRRYTLQSSKERSLAAKLMPVSGIMIFIFIIKHLLDFTLREKPQIELHDHMTADVYGMMLEKFSQPGTVIFYVFFMIAVALHLSHGLQSTLQTYGWYIPRKNSKAKLVSTLIAIGMAGTFAIIPIVAFTR